MTTWRSSSRTRTTSSTELHDAFVPAGAMRIAPAFLFRKQRIRQRVLPLAAPSSGLLKARDVSQGRLRSANAATSHTGIQLACKLDALRSMRPAIKPENPNQSDHADHKLDPDHGRCIRHDSAAAQHHQQWRGKKPPRQPDRHSAYNRIQAPQTQQLPLQNQNRRAVVDPDDVRLHDRAEHDQAHAINMHDNAADQHGNVVPVCNPDGRKQEQSAMPSAICNACPHTSGRRPRRSLSNP